VEQITGSELVASRVSPFYYLLLFQPGRTQKQQKDTTFDQGGARTGTFQKAALS